MEKDPLPFLRIGHRGAKGYKTENTLDSFAEAVARGANAVELDVRRSWDGRLVVSHDETLKQVYGREISVRDASLRELKEASGGLLVTLEEALSFIGPKVATILIELKEVGYEGQVVEAVRSAGLVEKAVISSFHEEALARTNELAPEVETGLIYARHKNPLEAALRVKARYLIALYRFVHRKDVEKAHQKGLRIIVWTINTKEEAEGYRAKGVDGIASDRPDILAGIE